MEAAQNKAKEAYVVENAENGHLTSSLQQETTLTPAPVAVKFPPLQIILAPQPPGSYDPNRIPLSIFATKPTNPGEWSVTSTELFSIQMGNGSFSHDCDFLFNKSGELSNPEGWNSSQPNLTEEVKDDHDQLNDLDSDKKSGIEEINKSHFSDEVKTAPYSPASVPEVKKNASPVTVPAFFPSSPRRSDGSGNSFSSFAFPLLELESPRELTSSGSLNVIQEKLKKPVEAQQDHVPKEPVVRVESRRRRNSLFSCFIGCC